MGEGFRQRAGKVLWCNLVERQLEYAPTEFRDSTGSAVKFRRRLIVSDDHDLLMGIGEHGRGNPVGCDEDSVLSSDSRQQSERLLRPVAMLRFSTVGENADERNRRHRVSGGRRGVLEGLAGSGQYAQGS